MLKVLRPNLDTCPYKVRQHPCTGICRLVRRQRESIRILADIHPFIHTITRLLNNVSHIPPMATPESSDRLSPFPFTGFDGDEHLRFRWRWWRAGEERPCQVIHLHYLRILNLHRATIPGIYYLMISFPIAPLLAAPANVFFTYNHLLVW